MARVFVTDRCGGIDAEGKGRGGGRIGPYAPGENTGERHLRDKHIGKRQRHRANAEPKAS
ncbi:hypothetical protein [Ancylobacter sp. IITR112]|uniref:hypothetical protein n=1 Tax=Ancylobacter sp. IITR112 TaxID=3138073 RepID=UPI003529D49A